MRPALNVWIACGQGLKMWGALSELEELKRVPDTSGFQRLNPGDSLTFVSHAWNISLDPASGAAPPRIYLFYHLLICWYIYAGTYACMHTGIIAPPSYGSADPAPPPQNTNPPLLRVSCHKVATARPSDRLLQISTCAWRGRCRARSRSGLAGWVNLHRALEPEFCIGAGSLSGLQRRWASRRRVGAQWANASRPLGRFVYSTYTAVKDNTQGGQ